MGMLDDLFVMNCVNGSVDNLCGDASHCNASEGMQSVKIPQYRCPSEHSTLRTGSHRRVKICISAAAEVRN
jgi:hypothetical protein